MRIYLFLSTLFFYHISLAQQVTQPIGSWKEYLPYTSAMQVIQGDDRLYAATPYSLFTVEPATGTIERLSRITGLSETGISRIGYDGLNKKLLVAYDNSNIDILYRNDVLNIPDIQRDNITGDKTIYNIYSAGNNFYLSTGLGIIVIDGDRYEVKDTWFIGDGGGQVKVNGVTSDNAFFYAATAQGLKRAATSSVSLADYNDWVLLSGASGLSAGPCESVFVSQGNVIVQKNDSLFVQTGNAWHLLYTDGWQITNADISADKIILCERKPGEARVTILNGDGSPDRIVGPGSVLAQPHDAILVQNEPWVADGSAGLLHFGATVDQYQPNSPQSIATGEMVSLRGIFYATAGGVDASWNPQGNTSGIYRLETGAWTNINRIVIPSLDTARDFISIGLDPADQTAWAGSFGGGLLHLKADNSIELFKQGVLSAAVTDPSSYRVAGLAFDRENNLWIANYGAALPLVVRKTDGSWKQFAVPFSLPENALTQVIADDNNYKWIVAAKGGGLICFDDNSTPDNTGDDRWKRYGAGAGGGNGNLPVGDVLCVAKDKNGFAWVGTSNGIGVIQCTQDVFGAAGCEATWPVVKQGNFAGYLFNGEEVRSIAVDGADRKWVATNSGAFLISATGEEIIFRFSKDNSPLLDDDVRMITIDGQSGEVFFATVRGICSFRSTATEGGELHSDVLVFPNPVPPGYSGSIGIRGLSNNAIVKITEMDGRLVYQARAMGGQAVWDGKDYKGRKIATGVYLVLVSSDDHDAKTVAKIIFIGK